MKGINGMEFFRFEAEVWYRMPGDMQKKLVEGDPAVYGILNFLTDNYPDAHLALLEEYGRQSNNARYQRFLMANRFCKCNWGVIDHKPDVCGEGRANFEHVPCPMRGECKYENVICHPVFNGKISDAEMRVINLMYKGFSRTQIAEELFISPYTVGNHIRNACARIGVSKEVDLLAYAVKNNLVKDE
jgi:DNA-binding CsgD family transcriptional regulator